MLGVQQLEKSFAGSAVLRNIEFQLKPQIVLGVIGASGSGKTTLMRCITGLTRFEQGRVQCRDVTLEAGLPNDVYAERVRALRRHVGMVFQHLYLFPHMTILDNLLEAPVHAHGMPRAEVEAQAHQWLEQFGITHTTTRYPASLSGGEQQRVAIIRALMTKPSLLFMDEPTSALDPRRCSDVRGLLRGYVDQGHTMVIVSHSMGFLKGLADEIMYMEDGVIVEHGPADQIFEQPQDPRTIAFLEYS